MMAYIKPLRRASVLLLLGLLASWNVVDSSARAGADGPGQQRPNILLITVDDLNWNSLGVTGAGIPGLSPNVDRLARNGMLFGRAHVTVAICHPSRNVWMTARYPQNAGALGFEDIGPKVPTLVEALEQAGYYTGLMAKTSHVVPSRAAAWNEIVKAQELRAGRGPDRYFEHTRDFLRHASLARKPFFLMVNSEDPHRPFAGSEQEEEVMAHSAGKHGSKYEKGFPAADRIYRPSEVTVPGFLPDLPDIRQELAEYYTSVHRMDETVGEVLRALDESGQAERTIVMWLSDNGMPFPFAKANVWQNSTRTPWIIRWPGVVPPGTRDDRHFVSGVDLAPTILDAAGLPNLKGAEGRSFVPLLRGRTQGGREYVFTQIDKVSSGTSYPMRAVTDARYTYIFNAWFDGKTEFRAESMSGRTFAAMRRAAAGNPAIAARVRHFIYRTQEELYDSRRDPDALNNLVNDPKYAATVSSYRNVLLRHMRESADPELPVFEWFMDRHG